MVATVALRKEKHMMILTWAPTVRTCSCSQALTTPLRGCASFVKIIVKFYTHVNLSYVIYCAKLSFNRAQVLF